MQRKIFTYVLKAILYGFALVGIFHTVNNTGGELVSARFLSIMFMILCVMMLYQFQRAYHYRKECLEAFKTIEWDDSDHTYTYRSPEDELSFYLSASQVIACIESEKVPKSLKRLLELRELYKESPMVQGFLKYRYAKQIKST